MDDKPRCQAYMLTPSTRYWAAKYRDADLRCKFPSKNGTNFCGVHKQIASIIEEIIWKDVDGSGTQES